MFYVYNLLYNLKANKISPFTVLPGKSIFISSHSELLWQLTCSIFWKIPISRPQQWTDSLTENTECKCSIESKLFTFIIPFSNFTCDHTPKISHRYTSIVELRWNINLRVYFETNLKFDEILQIHTRQIKIIWIIDWNVRRCSNIFRNSLRKLANFLRYHRPHLTRSIRISKYFPRLIFNLTNFLPLRKTQIAIG